MRQVEPRTPPRRIVTILKDDVGPWAARRCGVRVGFDALHRVASVFPSRLAGRCREQLSELRRLSDDDKEGRLSAGEGHGHHPTALVGKQVLSRLQQPLLQAQRAPGMPLASFVHVSLSRQGVSSITVPAPLTWNPWYVAAWTCLPP